MQRVSLPLALPLLSGAGFSVYILTSKTESCDEDDGDVGEGVVEEELADKPGTTKWYIVRKIAINFPALFGEMWFLTAGPVACIPMILTDLLQGKNCGSIFKKHNFVELTPIL